MLVKVYSVYDLKTAVYSPPMCYHSDGHMMREVTLQVRQNESLKSYPADYEVHQVGEWNDGTGELTPLSPSRLVTRLDRLLESDDEQG